VGVPFLDAGGVVRVSPIDGIHYDAEANPALAEVMRVPDTEVYVVDVSFAAVADAAERDYLNALPTSLVLSPEAVDRLRAAAAKAVAGSAEFRRFLRDAGYVVERE